MSRNTNANDQKPTVVMKSGDSKSVEEVVTPDDVTQETDTDATDIWSKIKAGAAKVSELAEDATELGKTKLEIVRIESAINKQYMKCGIKIWELHEHKKLNEAEKELSQEFESLTGLHDELRQKRKQADSISLIE